MTTVLTLLALIALFAGLAHLTRNDDFAGPTIRRRLHDRDGFLIRGYYDLR